jgi:hypothetical protein
MTTLAEIENAVIALPREQKQALYQFLQRQLNESARVPHSVMDIKPVQLGTLLGPIDASDLLDEMLGGRQ